MFRRLPDWPKHLAAYLEEQRTTGFVWGTTDCVHFIDGAINAVIGWHCFGAYRGAYSTAAGAYKTIRQQGYPDLIAAIDGELGKALGAERVPVARAQRGDVVAVAEASGMALGVVFSPGLWLRRVEAGLVNLPRSRAEIAWAI